MGWLLAAFVVLWGGAWLARRLLPKDGAPRRAPEALDAAIEELEPQPHQGDELDLHGVAPREIASLVEAFVDAACARGTRSIRIIHGKGIGAARATVRATLAGHEAVRRFADAPPPSSWGATVADLRTDGCAVDRDPASD